MKRCACILLIAAMAAAFVLAVCFLTDFRTHPAFASGPDPIPAAATETSASSPAETAAGGTYVSAACLYMNPLSSYAAPNGDSGCLYRFDADALILLRKDTGEVQGTLPLHGLEWRPLSESEWLALFLPVPAANVPAIGGYGKPLMHVLSAQYRLFNMDGALWFGEYRGEKIGMWSVYSLAPESAASQITALPQPDLPLSEDVIAAAFAQTGLPGVISKSETQTGAAGSILYTLRDPEKTYADSESKVMTAAVSSALVGGERFLSTNFPTDLFEPGTHPFAWADWKPQIVCTTLLYGGFMDDEALYRALCAKEVPPDAKSFKTEAEFSGAYCRIYYSRQDAHTIRSSLGNTVLAQRGWLFLSIYESKAFYQRTQQEAAAYKKALEDSRAQKTP